MKDLRTTMTIVAMSGLLVAACGGTDATTTGPTATEPTAAGLATATDGPAGDPDSTPVATSSPATDGSPDAEDLTAAAPSVAVSATPDALMGANVEVTTAGFRWAPEHASTDPVDGEGHAHLYVDDVKVARLYTPWFHVSGLEPGEHTVRVTLNANDHEDLHHDGAPLEATTTVTIPEAGAAMGEHGGHQVPAPMTVAVDAQPDARMGVNLHLTTTGFRWAPEHASNQHVDGEGHAHVYVDGEKVGRLYGEWLHLSLDPGEHEIRVTLNGNDHGDYVDGQEAVAATTTVTVPEATDEHSH